ncbi:MAG: hypothetical protein NTX25_20670, partial [Proteobacteria bacterium]|nr:hypothetical protein [Pseudomonadota bacterium]
MHTLRCFGYLGLVLYLFAAQSALSLDYCRDTADNGEGYGKIRYEQNQALRWVSEASETSCITTRVCSEAENGEGYGIPYWSKAKLYRKIDQNWANSDASNWCLVHSSLSAPELELFEHKGRKLFLTGVNLGNVQFLPFRNAPYAQSEAEIKDLLRKAFADLKASGANSFRFWLHIDGSRSPSFSKNGLGEEALVSGLPAGLIEDLQWMIRTAYQDYGLLVDINLWSHDVLAVRREHGVSSRDRVVHMITDDAATEAYIDKALKPLVQSLLQKMPNSNESYADGVLSWEVFNEPEGVSSYWRLYWNYQYAMRYGDYAWKGSSLAYLDDRRRTESAIDTHDGTYTPIKYRG